MEKLNQLIDKQMIAGSSPINTNMIVKVTSILESLSDSREVFEPRWTCKALLHFITQPCLPSHTMTPSKMPKLKVRVSH